MKILAGIPLTRSIAPALESIEALRWPHLDRLYLRGGDAPGADYDTRWQNLTEKGERARLMAIAGGYDALLTIDDDMILPADAVERLAACDAHIAYGLYVLRGNLYGQWNAAEAMTDSDFTSWSDKAGAWGKVIDVAGCGLGCTLIRREVLLTTRFQRRGQHAYDYYLALDARRNGFSQKCDTRCTLGHVDVDRNAMLWPTPDGFREVSL